MSELLKYRCPNCGQILEFDSGTQQMKCPYCDSMVDVQALSGYDEELKNVSSDELKWDKAPGTEWDEEETKGMRVYVCDSCGGEIIADENASAMKCPYCDNAVIMKGNVSGVLKPDLIIPFKLDKNQAKELYHKHLQGKKFLPRVFENENHIDEIKAIYVPFWLFHADVDYDVRFRGTRTRLYSDARNNYTETSYYAVNRVGTLAFDQVPVDGSSSIADDLMQSIEPFDITEAKPFQTAYLSGYLADKYDVDAQDAVSIANARIKSSTEQAVMSTVANYESLSVERSAIRYNNGRAMYALYPVWILNTTYAGQRYIFALNGQTGKTVGDLPVSKSAYWKNFFLVGGITAALVFAGSMAAMLL